MTKKLDARLKKRERVEDEILKSALSKIAQENLQAR